MKHKFKKGDWVRCVEGYSAGKIVEGELHQIGRC